MLRDCHHLYRSALFDELPWLRHGFGTRHEENWPGEYTRLRQTHSSTVVDAGDRHGTLGEGDALITSHMGNWIGVRTADCVPVLLADRRNKVVGAVHAGWRGTAARIVGKAVQLMGCNYGTEARDLSAAIGPAIGACCFEVGPEVAAQFEGLLPGASKLKSLDLVELNRQILLALGVAVVDTACLCTKCVPGEFHSYRRDKGISGRMVSAIQVRP